MYAFEGWRGVVELMYVVFNAVLPVEKYCSPKPRPSSAIINGGSARLQVRYERVISLCNFDPMWTITKLSPTVPVTVALK